MTLCLEGGWTDGRTGSEGVLSTYGVGDSLWVSAGLCTQVSCEPCELCLHAGRS